MRQESNIDLHLHTTWSDGLLDVEQLLRLAKRRGLRLVCIADHDSIAAYPQALRVAARLGITVIPGVELTVTAGPFGEFHVLGLGIDWRLPVWRQHQRWAARERDQRARSYVRKLRMLGFDITYAAVRRLAKGAIAKPQVARVLLTGRRNRSLLRRYGLLELSVHHVIEALLEPGRPAFVNRRRLPWRRAVQMIHRAGGQAVLAHVSVEVPWRRVPRALVAFRKVGGDGVEVFIPSHTRAQVLEMRHHAKRYRLAESVGSDFHAKSEPLPGYRLYGLQPRWPRVVGRFL